MGIKGYKVVNPDYTPQHGNEAIKEGMTLKHNGPIGVCSQGYHFCQNAAHCFNYYDFDERNHVFEVEATGLVETESNKSVTDELQILREITWEEVLRVANTGTGCTGHGNTGHYNTGNCNTGNRNTGDCNTGNRNTGDCNTGNWNTGDCNTGNRNTGDWNTGDWNTANFHTGLFNTKPAKLSGLFDAETDLSRDDIMGEKGVQALQWHFENSWWIYSNNMSDDEKAAHPEHETTGGYLKTVPFKEACAIMWDNLDDDDREAVKNITNFDAKVFEEITGINVNK